MPGVVFNQLKCPPLNYWHIEIMPVLFSCLSTINNNSTQIIYMSVNKNQGCLPTWGKSSCRVAVETGASDPTSAFICHNERKSSF